MESDFWIIFFLALAEPLLVIDLIYNIKKKRKDAWTDAFGIILVAVLIWATAIGVI